jgi:transcription initiation factor IIE alpha subunit
MYDEDRAMAFQERERLNPPTTVDTLECPECGAELEDGDCSECGYESPRVYAPRYSSVFGRVLDEI